MRTRHSGLVGVVWRMEARARSVLRRLESRDVVPLRPLFRLARQREFWRFVRFVLTGGVNFAFSYTVFLLAHLLGATPTLAVVIQWVLGVLFNFVTTSRIVFGTGDLRLLTRFVAVYVVQLGLNIVGLRALLALGLSAPVGQALIITLLAVVTFFALRRFVFATHLSEAAAD